MTFLPFVLRRARRHWQILLTLILGATLTTALLASGPLLLDTITEMGLRLTFQSASVADGNLRLVATKVLDQAEFHALDSRVQALLQRHLGKHLNAATWSAQSPWFFPGADGQVLADQRVRLHAYQDIRDHIDYIAGEWPAEVSEEPGILRAVINEAMARALILRVGDLVPLSLGQDGTEPDIWIEVAGIVHPQNPLDPYWFGEFSPLTSQSTQRWSGQHSVIVPENSFFPAVASLFPDGQIEVAWYALLKSDTLTAADIEPLQTHIEELETQLGALEPQVTLYTGVPEILANFQRQLDSIRVPVYILVAEVMLLVLYYVIMISALAMRQVEREFAILRSRGTSGWQITRIQLAEALIIVIIVLLIGPWLGAVLVKGLSWAGPLADLGRADWSLSLNQSAWLAAIVGALACLAGLLLPLGPALRRSIVTHQRLVGRSTLPPWWQRYYLDVFILVGGLILLWRLRLYGGMISGGPGGVRLDWLLLLSPVALLLGSATILLRVFPLILGAIASLVARGRGLAAALALWQASRNPTHVTRLVLLLTLAIALGTLSTGLNKTLDQSEYDRAYYLAGNDLRLVSQRAVPLVDLQSAPGVLELSAAWRGQGKVDLGGPETETGEQNSNEEFTTQGDGSPKQDMVEVLAIEPDSFGRVTTYRDDFAEQDMNSLLTTLFIQEGEHPALLPLPGQPAGFGLWLWGPPEDKAAMNSWARWIDGDNDAERLGLVAKLQTAQGELFTVPLQRQISSEQAALQTDRLDVRMNIGGRDVGLHLRIKPDTMGWHYFEGPVPVLPPSSYPLSLHSLWFQNQATRLGESIAKGMFVVADDIIVVDGETQEAQIVEDFEGEDRPLFLNAMQEGNIWYGLITYMIGQVSHAGERAQLVSLGYTRPLQTYPLRLRQTWTKEPLPALASPAFIEATQLEPGQVVRVQLDDRHQAGLAEVDFRIAGTVNHFPTMYGESDAGYLITSRDLLLALLNDTAQFPTNPNEVFIQTDDSTPIDSLSSMVPMLSQSWEAESVRKALKANPLALGLRSVTFFGSVLMILLSLVGFATHFYLSIRQRDTLYGVMRAMGMSSRQMYASIVIEQAVLILAGLGLGTILGVLLNQITLSRLPVSLGDRPPVPPFVPREDWLAVALLYLGLVVAFLIILGIVTALLWRARIHRVLRIGQE